MEREVYTPARARALGGLTLAFFGDSVYEVLVRRTVVDTGTLPVNTLHKKAVERVNAGFQSRAMDALECLLTEAELDIFKRGRNASGNNVPRSSNSKDYRRATGFEALFGYLYLTGQIDRMNELFSVVLTVPVKAE